MPAPPIKLDCRLIKPEIEIETGANLIQQLRLDAVAPWTVFKRDRNAAAGVIRVAINLIRVFAVLSAPMIPSAAGRMLAALRLPAEPIGLASALGVELQKLGPRHPFDVPDLLFAKIEDVQIERWKSEFGDSQGPPTAIESH